MADIMTVPNQDPAAPAIVQTIALKDAFALLDAVEACEARHQRAVELVHDAFAMMSRTLGPAMQSYMDCALATGWRHVQVPEAELMVLSRVAQGTLKLPPSEQHPDVLFATFRFMRSGKGIHAVRENVRLADYVGRHDTSGRGYDIVENDQALMTLSTPFPALGHFVLPAYIPGVFGKEPGLKPALSLAEQISDGSHGPTKGLVLALLAERRAKARYDNELQPLLNGAMVRLPGLETSRTEKKALGQLLATMTTLTVRKDAEDAVSERKISLARSEIFRLPIADAIRLTSHVNPGLMPEMLRLLKGHPDYPAVIA